MINASEVDEYSVRIRRSFEDGDRRALLRMLWFSLLYRWPAPDWAVTAFDALYRASLDGEIVSWDDVFGRPCDRLSTDREGSGRAFEIWSKVREIAEQEGRSISQELFERVGRELRIDGTATAERYHAADRSVRGIAPHPDSPKA